MRLLFGVFSITRPIATRRLSAFPVRVCLSTMTATSGPNGAKQQKPNGKGAKKEVKILMLHGECYSAYIEPPWSFSSSLTAHYPGHSHSLSLTMYSQS